MSHVPLGPVDELRKKLRTTERDLIQTRRELKRALEANERLREEIEKLKKLPAKMREVVSEAFPEGSSWRLYDAPGACGFCGSLTCSGRCVK